MMPVSTWNKQTRAHRAHVLKLIAAHAQAATPTEQKALERQLRLLVSDITPVTSVRNIVALWPLLHHHSLLTTHDWASVRHKLMRILKATRAQHHPHIAQLPALEPNTGHPEQIHVLELGQDMPLHALAGLLRPGQEQRWAQMVTDDGWLSKRYALYAYPSRTAPTWWQHLVRRSLELVLSPDARYKKLALASAYVWADHQREPFAPMSIPPGHAPRPV